MWGCEEVCGEVCGSVRRYVGRYVGVEGMCGYGEEGVGVGR